MAKNSFIAAYVHFFSFLSKLLLLFVFCAVFALAVVTPLWKFSVSNPSLYSLTLGLLVLAFVLFLSIKKIRLFFIVSERDEQKVKIQNLLRSLLLFFLGVLSLGSFVFFVMNGSRYLGFIFLSAGIFLYGIVSFVYKRK